jgi:hypothetical protein
MKAVFPLLLCYVLTTAQTFALSGGPIFGGGRVSTTGIYSGVLQGQEEIDSTTSGPAIPGDPIPTDPNVTGTPSNALGLFSLTVPATLLATGAFMLFADGEIFSGTINASADPDSGQLKGLLEGSFNFTLQTFDSAGAAVSTAITATAVGQLTARVSASNSLTALSLARLNGNATLAVNFGQVDGTTFAPIIARTITFTVTGFKQSS